jgi:predicted dehydrogenase
MIKVAIVGCGKIADSHALQIQRINGCEIVGVCDQEELMAKQLSDRFRVPRYFSNMTQLLEEVRPDVVHITTPPQSHLAIGMQCLESGCHIFVEKPFTMDTDEAEILIKKANQKCLKLTVGHDAQYSDVSLRMRKIIHEGYLGDRIVHIESFWCYDLSDITYAKSLLNDKEHWSRRLPGGLLHNIISHGVAKIAEFITSNSLHVMAYGFVSPFLKKLGENDLVDELRAIIYDATGTTANFTFSSQMRPSLHQLYIYGSENGLMLDEDQRIIVKLPGNRFKSYAEHFIPPANYAKQYLANLNHNISRFLAMDFHMDYGKKVLIESFYKSIIAEAPLPVPYQEILLTSRIMDEIFKQIGSIRPIP